ncbi:ABC transporter transmembrane domain-containing protein [[Actinomadura] parvosata]|uniref:ABC transporter transmembrane domain-containing protein n=1 Tax=[Actinomadura] parvosata TaxID=1955412 RepID=UPI001FE3DFFF
MLAGTAVVGAAGELAVPYLIGRTVDTLVTRGPDATHWLALCAAAVAAVMLCESIGVWARGASGAHAAATLRTGVLRHVLGTGSAATRRFPEGELVTRAGLNAEEVGRAPETVTSALALLVPTAGALVALTLIAPVLTLTLGAGIVVILLVLRAFLRATTTISGGYQEVQGEIAARLVEALGGARTIAAAGTAGRESRRVLAPLPGCARTGWGCGGPTPRPPSGRGSSCRCWRSPCSPRAASCSPPATSPSESSTPPRATPCSGPRSARRWATSAAWPGRAPPPDGWPRCSTCHPSGTAPARSRPGQGRSGSATWP